MSRVEEIDHLSTLFNLEDLGLTESVVLAHKAATLARYTVGGLMRQAQHSVIDERDLRLLEDCLYAAEAHTWDAQRKLEANPPPDARAHSPLNEDVIHGKRVNDCPVCGAGVMGGTGENVTCNRCKVELHGECYWGRVATLAEWQRYIRHVNAGPDDDYEGPPVVCAQCRAKGEGA